MEGPTGRTWRGATAVVAFVVLLSFLPGAVGEWRAYGAFEPDSRHDDEAFLHLRTPAEYAAEGAAKPKIYFNAFPQARLAFGGGWLNPNNAVTHSQVGSTPMVTWVALLGYWNDCNGDGYVGHFESALREYRAEILTPEQLDACPESSKAPVRQAARNLGVMIIEFIPIAREGVQDPYSVVDPDAMVWGDRGLPTPMRGLPESFTPDYQPTECNHAGLQGMKGSYDTVGGVLNNMECRTGRAGVDAWNLVVPAILGEDWRFNNGHYDQPGHPVGDRDTFGRNDSREHAYVAWADCSQGPLVDFGRVLGSDRAGHGPRPPRAQPRVDPEGNVAGTYNETYESTLQNCRTQREGDRSGDYDREFYDMLEGSSGSTGFKEHRGKTNADYNFQYREMSRSSIPCGPLSRSADCGVTPLNPLLGGNVVGHNAFWSAQEEDLRGPRGTFSGRETAEDRLPEATHYTFYAKVGNRSLSRGDAPGGLGVYGDAFCGAGLQKYRYGWNCDVREWNTGGDGTLLYPHAVPYQRYHFRDVDCFDGTLAAGTPLSVSPQKWGEQPCQDDGLLPS